MDHSWMDRRVVDWMISSEYRKGVEYFCDFAFGNAALLHQRRDRCPCNRCGNREIFERDTITVHLYQNEFLPNYKYWYPHGEIEKKLLGLEVSRTGTQIEWWIWLWMRLILNLTEI